ncbi:MAG: prepilin-type N-terminal cleavage/methylation domain-containing protein [Chlorobium sp.]|nr:prepilin-type N-terminal cleavage/methylation domain-containing protein [Chlorobium sp.]
MQKIVIHKQKQSEQGFTLIEVLVAIAVLTIGILSLYSMHVSSINGNASASNMTMGTNWASDRVEILLSRPYNHSDLEDDNGDGTNEPVDANGADTDGGNFGLDNATPTTADGRDTSPDNRYTILWNVGIDTPVPNCKTIRVIVTSQDHGVTKSIPVTYFKYEQI